MSKLSIGRVQPNYRGIYQSSEEYEKLDHVVYNGSTYVALQKVPNGISPEGGSSENYWKLIAKKGDKGDPGNFDGDTKAPVIMDTASGATVSFSDGAEDISIKTLTINIEPIQTGSGDPSFENIRSIYGIDSAQIFITEKNIADGLTMEYGYYDSNGSPTQSSNARRTPEYISYKTGVTYCLAGKFNIDGVRIRIHEYDENKIWLRQVKQTAQINAGIKRSITWTPSADAAYFRFSVPLYDELFCGELTKEYSIPFGGGTVYSGILDAVNKKLIINKAIVDLGTLNWTNSTTNRFMYSDGITSNVVKPSSNNEVANIVATHMVAASANDVDTTSGNYIGIVTNGNIRCRFDGFSSDPVEFKSSVSGVMLLYELASPIEIDLNDIPTITTIYGNNNIWSNAGDMKIEYRADTKLYLQQAFHDIDFKVDINNYAVNLIPTQFPGLYLNSSSVESSSNAMTIVYSGLPGGKYLINKRLATVFRVGYGDTDRLEAGVPIQGYTARVATSNESLYISLPQGKYLYIQLWGSNDASSLKDVAANLASLVIFKQDRLNDTIISAYMRCSNEEENWQVSLPGINGAYAASYDIWRYGNIFSYNGISNMANRRCSLTGTVLETTNLPPDPGTVPAWYVDDIPGFIIGHKYKFELITINGSYVPNDANETPYFTLRNSAGDFSLTTRANGTTWICTKAINMVCLLFKQGTFNNYIAYYKITDLTKRENDLREAIGGFSYAVPEYFDNQLITAIDKINTDINSNKTDARSGTDIESFIFITDVHWRGNKQHSPALIKQVLHQTPISTVIHGGDLIEGHRATKQLATIEATEFINAIKQIPCYEFYNIFGNHDDNTNTNPDISISFTKDELYNVLMSTFCDRKNVHWIWEEAPAIFNEDLVCLDYYVDHPRTRTRYLCIDWTTNITVNTIRANWIQSVLAKDDGFRVIVFYHGIYSRDRSVEGELTPGHTGIMSVIEPYKTKVAALFTGHAHLDAVIDYYGDGSVPVIITGNDRYQESEGAVAGTVTEQCFDVAVVDYKQQKIKLTRIGRGSNREIDINIS